MTEKEKMRIKKQEIHFKNIKFVNDNPIDLEKYKGRDNEMLIAVMVINQRKQIASLNSIQNNVKFFFWATIIGWVIGVITILTYLQ